MPQSQTYFTATQKGATLSPGAQQTLESVKAFRHGPSTPQPFTIKKYVAGVGMLLVIKLWNSSASASASTTAASLHPHALTYEVTLSAAVTGDTELHLYRCWIRELVYGEGFSAEELEAVAAQIDLVAIADEEEDEKEEQEGEQEEEGASDADGGVLDHINEVMVEIAKVAETRPMSVRNITLRH